jgi:hypothetical protein
MANKWQLYSTVEGWEACEARLDAALERVLASLDRRVNLGRMTIRGAAFEAFQEFTRDVLSAPENDRYGAVDSEPRDYLAVRLAGHVRTRYGVNLRMDRYGDVSEGR